MKSPYLKPNRLPDLIAAIQFMAMNERSSLPCDRWAEGISGDHSKASHWRGVFDEHPEFFRKSPDNEDHYALIWRRALPRRYFRPEGRLLTELEVEKLPEDERGLVSRPPVPETQVKALADIVISLHAKHYELSRDWRWWVPVLASFGGSILGTLLGLGIWR